MLLTKNDSIKKTIFSGFSELIYHKINFEGDKKLISYDEFCQMMTKLKCGDHSEAFYYGLVRENDGFLPLPLHKELTGRLLNAADIWPA